jgi:outer membrane protein assembly factor BamB
MMRRPIIATMLALGFTTGSMAADWPMYRHDSARSGYTAENLPSQLSLAWRFRSVAPPQRAWPRSLKQRFDECYQPIISEGRVYFGSSADCKLYCLDAASGEVLWTYFTGGPIRFAPVAWQGHVAVASDDGLLHVVDAATGKFLWRHRGGLDASRRLGNERMISKWPARGGPTLLDGVLYYAAGIWPSDGIFVYALDPVTGKELWSNKDSGGIYMPQPHGGANAASGISAQGHLAAKGDRLIIPTGRAVPAALHRADGELAFFHLQKNRAIGGTFAALLGDNLFNGGVAFDAAEGELAGKVGFLSVAEMPDGFVSGTASSVRAFRWNVEEKPDRRGKPIKTQTLQSLWTATGVPAANSLVVAGATAIAGSSQRVTLLSTAKEVDADSSRVLWSSEVSGIAAGLAVADQQLVVSTTTGDIYCFAAKGTGEDVAETTNESPYDDATAINGAIVDAAVEQILKRAAMREGYCLDLGCGNGHLTYELALKTDLTIIAIDSDADNVRVAREKLSAAGLYGTRVTVHHGDPANSGYPKYFANLIVSGRSTFEGADSVPAEEMQRLQRPYGGVTCVGVPDKMEFSRRGDLAGAGGWTHQYANPANTVCSDDELISGSLGILWFRDFDLALPSRHGRGPAPLVHRGRLFHEGLDELRAVDAYNGRELWSYELPEVLRAFDGDHLMGTAGTGSNFCVSDEGVFVRYGNKTLQIDAETGQHIGEFVVPGAGEQAKWGYIACDGGTLYGSVADPTHVVSYRYRPGGDMNQQLTESKQFFAYDIATGKLLWKYSAKDSIRHNTIAIGKHFVYLIDRQAAVFDRTKNAKANPAEHPFGALVALDKATGDLGWRVDEQIFGTTLAVSDEHHILVMSYQNTSFKLASEIGGRLAAFDSRTGDRKWDQQTKYRSRLTVNSQTVYSDGGAWDLLTGQTKQFNFKRSYGCGVLSGSKNFVFFRSATLGYFDLNKNEKVQNFGGMRPGCWINAIPAGGLVLVPDASAQCSCSYLNQAWFALEPLE